MLGEILTDYRERNGVSQEQLAHELGISRNYLSQIELGKSTNVSFSLGKRILSLGRPHGQIEVTIIRRVMIDAAIAPEIVWLNAQGVMTEGCCQGPPPTALIRPSSKWIAEELGYSPVYRQSLLLYEIELKSK